jgi:hypothetical protein
MKNIHMNNGQEKPPFQVTHLFPFQGFLKQHLLLLHYLCAQSDTGQQRPEKKTGILCEDHMT